MTDLIVVGVMVIVFAVAWIADWRGRQRWKSPQAEYRRACAQFDEMMRKEK